MLRLAVLLLAFANLLLLAWGQGWLPGRGASAAAQTEPQRLTQQINPQALVLLAVGEAARGQPPAPAAAASAPATCLQSPPLETGEADAVRSVLSKDWPAGSWVLTVMPGTDRWLVYTGKFDNAADLAKKRAQLAGLGVKFFPLANASLAPGLSLGEFRSAAAAEAALESLKARGVRTARVLQDTPANARYLLRLPVLDAAAQARLAPLQAALAAKALLPCTAEPPTAAASVS